MNSRQARQRGMLTWIWIVFWLIFLVDPIFSNIAEGGRRTVGAVLVLIGGIAYAPGATLAMRRLWAGKPRTPRSQAFSGTMALIIAACTLAAAPLIGQDAFALLPYSVVILAMGLGRSMGAVFAICVVAAFYSLSVSLTGRTMESGLLFATLASGVAAGLGAYSAERTQDADAAREDAALLRVQDERNRMARDLHDILGHSLTVITMKAELAGKLIEVDPAKAKEQIAEVEKLSRGALADVRQTVSGYREMSLAGELARSRRALTDAGIGVEMPGSVEDVSPDLRELFAWTVREATTNIIRHSGAARCRIVIDPDRITISDDGNGVPDDASTNGHGLVGLRERAAAHGARVTTRSSGGFTLTVEALPDGPDALGTETPSPARSSLRQRVPWSGRATHPIGAASTPTSLATPEEN